MKRIKTFLFIVSITFISIITMSFQGTREIQKQVQKYVNMTNSQTQGISSCIYAGGYCWANGKIYQGITSTKS